MYLSIPVKNIGNLFTHGMKNKNNIGKRCYISSQSQESHNLLPEGLVLGLGNPLLDITAVVGEDFLKKYDLKPNSAVVATSKHLPLYKELVEKGEGVRLLYHVNDKLPTGTCAVLLTGAGTNRSLCANLGSAALFSEEILSESPIKKAIQQAKAIYTSVFFIAVSWGSLMQIAQHAFKNKLLFILNTSAEFVITKFKTELGNLFPYVDLVFGNNAEAQIFAKVFGLKSTSLEDIAIEMADQPKLYKERPRIVVITRNKEPLIIAHKGTVKLFPVTRLKPEEVVDTNGAGDAFTGGFISQLVQGKALNQCVQGGIYTAKHVIRNIGCTFSGPSNFKATD